MAFKIKSKPDECKPCPFCGNEAEILNSSFGYFVQCSKCIASTYYYTTKTRAKQAWNKRASEVEK